jgi:hypothetical protein
MKGQKKNVLLLMKKSFLKKQTHFYVASNYILIGT